MSSGPCSIGGSSGVVIGEMKVSETFSGSAIGEHRQRLRPRAGMRERRSSVRFFTTHDARILPALYGSLVHVRAGERRAVRVQSVDKRRTEAQTGSMFRGVLRCGLSLIISERGFLKPSAAVWLANSCEGSVDGWRRFRRQPEKTSAAEMLDSGTFQAARWKG